MQTRKFGFRSLALLSAAVFGLAACDDTNVVESPVGATITVSPTGPIDLTVGQSIQVVASATNPTGAITFTSSNPAVASVDATGVVRALTPGLTTVSASVAGATGTVTQGVLIRVSAAAGTPPPPTGTDTASINIVSIVDANNNPVNTAAVAGNIFVRVDYTRGRADSVQVLLNNTVVCLQTFNTVQAKIDAAGLNLSAAAVEFVCAVNTARSTAAGVTFPNGAATLTARLLDNNTTIASAQRAITLANVNNITGTITASRQNTDATGLLWNGGNVDVTASAATFSGAAVSRVTFTIWEDDDNDNVIDGGEGRVTITDLTAPFTAAFPEDSLTFASATTKVQVTSVTSAGGAGPTAILPSAANAPFRYDNVAPAGIAAPTPADFVGTDFRFFGTVDSAVVAASDDGVDRVTVTFHVVSDFSAFTAGSLSATQITNARAGRVVTTGADFTHGQEIDVVALACDALDNCRVLGGFDFTVDRNAPTIEDITIPTSTREDSVIFNVGDLTTGDIVIDVEDDVAGFDGTGLLVVGTRTFRSGGATVTRCVIGDEVTAANFNAAFTGENFADFDGAGPAADTDTVCEAVEILDQIPVPDGEGYYTFIVRTVDAAGNISAASRTIRILVDQAGPVVTDLDFDATLTGGAQETIEADITDNLDLNSYIVSINYTGLGDLPVGGFVPIDNTFGTPLTVTAAANTSIFFIAAIEEDVDDTDGINTGISDFEADQVTVRALDQAGNVFGETVNIAQSFAASNLGASLTGYDVDAPDDELDNDGIATATVRARVIVPEATTTNPVNRVFFYARTDAGGGAFNFVLIGVDTTATQSVSTTTRTFTYTAELSAAQAATIGANAEDETVDVVGIAVDADGNGIVEIETAAITIIE